MIMNDHCILIPARINSSRFPEKMLAYLNGKTLVETVFDKCKETGLDVYVLTDSKYINDLIGSENVIMTGHANNGTERCALAVKKLKKKYSGYINVQGDMPDITTDIIKSVSDLLAHFESDVYAANGDINVVTAYTDMKEQLQNDPNTVKMISTNTHMKKALWFGRGMTGYGDHHIGIYGYSPEALDEYSGYTSLHIPEEENKEMLEQIRWLKNGINVYATHVDFEGIEINTPEDLEKWKLNN